MPTAPTMLDRRVERGIAAMVTASARGLVGPAAFEKLGRGALGRVQGRIAVVVPPLLRATDRAA